MEDKKNSIFRKQALDRISSPEELDRYLVVTRPAVWFALLAIVILMIGALVWANLGHLESSLRVAVVGSEEMAVCLVPAEYEENVLSCGIIRVAGQEHFVSESGLARQIITDQTDINICNAGSLKVGSIVVPLKVEGYLPEGIYEGDVVIEVMKPISFIIN